MLRHVALATIALSAASAAAPPVQAREVVGMRDGRFDPGTIVIRTGERKLYFVTAPGEAIRYTVAVGKAGKQWRGVKYVEELAVEPWWIAPPEIRRARGDSDRPVPPGPRNPMGARAIGLGPGGDYAIHGTNDPSSIGKFVSFGCIRMFNADVIDLYARVRMGTPVIVTR